VYLFSHSFHSSLSAQPGKLEVQGKSLHGWGVPALVLPIAGSSFEAELGCKNT
jgi:hypothetical protein